MSPLAAQYDPFRKQLKSFTREAERIQKGDDEAVHRARVASRRLREMLAVLQLESDTATELARRLRKVTMQLGAVRELDVSMLAIQELGRDSRYPSTALKEVAAAVENARREARKHLVTKLPLAKMQRLAHRLERAVVLPDSPHNASHRPGVRRLARVWPAAKAHISRRAAQVRLAIEAAGMVYNPERLHDVRIALKKLRYAAEIGMEARGPRSTAEIATLKAAQDLLGRLHDLEVLVAHARHVQASLSRPELTTWRDLGLLVRAVEDDCRGLHARFIHHRARLLAIVDRMRGTRRPRGIVPHRAVS